MPHDSSICSLTAYQLQRLFKERKLSPVEVFQAMYTQAKEANRYVNAFCYFDAEFGLEQARQSENRWMHNAPMGILDGVPVTIKDTDDIKGWPTRKGSKNSSKSPAYQDSLSVARLREQGAIFFAKSTTPEFAAKGVTDSPLTGITRNPWNLKLTPGGSSGGSAVAVAIGGSPLATGSDGAGSIRIPASFTGIFGLKTTPGRVPRLPSLGIGDMSVHGPLARSSLDLAIMLQAISAPDWRDPFSHSANDLEGINGVRQGVRGIRIALTPHLNVIRPDQEILDAVYKAGELLEKAGATVEEGDPDLEDNPLHAFEVIWCTGNLGGVHDWLGTDKERFADQELIRIAKKALSFSALDYARAQAKRHELARKMIAFHQRYDLLLLPTTPISPFEAGHSIPLGSYFKEWYEWAPLTWLFNMTRQPAASVPVSLTSSLLPIGVQLVGRPFEENTILRACYALEYETQEAFKKHVTIKTHL